MIIDFNEFLNILMHISLIVLIISFIVVGFKLIKILGKVNSIMDDISGKMDKVNGVFEIIDKTTDYASSISDKVLNALSGLLSVFTKKKKGNDNYE